MELCAEVGDVARVEGPKEKLLDDGQEVVEGSSFRKRIGVRGSDRAPGSREQEGVLDDGERYTSSA